jgi:(p)ppGpp synthase/HD superfamily hydrolase
MKTLDVDRRAQTNLQLYRQLLAVGHAMQEVIAVRDAYVLAAKLFAGLLRPEGRPFVCHVVGVASLLAMVGAPRATIVAGLLHSAYSHGDFGYGKGQVAGNARNRVRAVVGDEIERVVAAYAHQRWNAAAVADWIATPGRIAAEEREIITIRLADSLEDALDLGLQLSEKQDNPNRDIAAESLVHLAAALECPALGAALRHALETPSEGMDLSGLRERCTGSHIVCPESWREKLLPRLARRMRRAP